MLISEISLKDIDSAQLGASVDKYIPISEHIKKLETEFKINYLFRFENSDGSALIFVLCIIY